MSNLSRNIKFMRHRKGLTQKQLAEAARIAVGSMSAYEKGTKEPPVGAAYRIACALDITLDELFTDAVRRCPHCGKLIDEYDEEECP